MASRKHRKRKDRPRSRPKKKAVVHTTEQAQADTGAAARNCAQRDGATEAEAEVGDG